MRGDGRWWDLYRISAVAVADEPPIAGGRTGRL
jgi:hypothetical protein